MIDYSSILKPVDTAPTDGEVLMFGTSLKRPGEPLSAPDEVGVWAFCHRGSSTWRDGMREFVPEGWVDLAEFAMEKQARPVAPINSDLRTPELASSKTQGQGSAPDYFITQIACNTIKANCAVHGRYEFSKIRQGDCVVPVFFDPPKIQPLTKEQRESIIQSAHNITEALMMAESVLGARP